MRAGIHDYYLPHVLTATVLVAAEPVADALGFTTPRELLRHLSRSQRLSLPAGPYGKAGYMPYVTGDGLRHALRIPLQRNGRDEEQVAQFREWVDSCFLPDLGLEAIDAIQGLRR